MSDKKEMLKVTVYRDNWLRGVGADDSCLLNSAGMMCCLGFVCKQMGATDDEMMMRKTPAALTRNKMFIDGITQRSIEHNLVSSSGVSSTVPCSQAMGVNDSENLTPQERESKIREIGLSFLDIEFEFVDGQMPKEDTVGS